MKCAYEYAVKGIASKIGPRKAFHRWIRQCQTPLVCIGSGQNDPRNKCLFLASVDILNTFPFY